MDECGIRREGAGEPTAFFPGDDAAVDADAEVLVVAGGCRPEVRVPAQDGLRIHAGCDGERQVGRVDIRPRRAVAAGQLVLRGAQPQVGIGPARNDQVGGRGWRARPGRVGGGDGEGVAGAVGETRDQHSGRSHTVDDRCPGGRAVHIRRHGVATDAKAALGWGGPGQRGGAVSGRGDRIGGRRRRGQRPIGKDLHVHLDTIPGPAAASIGPGTRCREGANPYLVVGPQDVRSVASTIHERCVRAGDARRLRQVGVPGDVLPHRRPLHAVARQDRPDILAARWDLM